MESTTTVNDKVFGTMEYKHGWFKIEPMVFCDTEYSVKIRADAYSGKRITEEQRQSFQHFNKQKGATLKKIAELMMDFVNSNITELFENWTETQKITDVRALPQVIKPTTLLFQRDGETIMLFDCVWDKEHGFAVQVYPEYKLGSQELFL